MMDGSLKIQVDHQKPSLGQKIAIVFNNGATLVGNVIEWSDQKSSVDTADGVVLIQRTLESVLLVKIFKNQPQMVAQPVDPALPPRQEEIARLKARFEQLVALPKRPDVLEEMVNLKKRINHLERLEITDPKSPSGPVRPLTEYKSCVLPINKPKSDPLQHSGEKSPGKNFSTNQRMPNLFRRKA